MESFDDGALVLRLNDRRMLALNSSAADILQRTNGIHGLQEVAALLSSEYMLDQKDTLLDVDELYRTLSAQNILEAVGEKPWKETT